MSIHSEHPFAEPEARRDPVRRLRARLGGAVSLWTTGGTVGDAPGGTTGDAPGVTSGTSGRVGLTVTSLMVAPGEPARVLALVDPDSDFAQRSSQTGTAVVQLLRWGHRDLADAFAGVAPAPGGAFRMGTWGQTSWGPLLDGVTAWAGVRLASPAREVGWSVLLDAVVEQVGIEDDGDALAHRRGRYVRVQAR